MYNFVWREFNMQVVKKSGIILIVSLLIMATGGFSVYQHMCHCAGEMTASFYKHENCDHHKVSEEKSCCSMKETKACCDQEPAKETKQTCHKDNCCKTTSLFIRINDAFQPGFEKVTLKPVIAPATVLFIDFSEDIISAPTLSVLGSDSSPPESGKEILTAIHQLKLDPHLV